MSRVFSIEELQNFSFDDPQQESIQPEFDIDSTLSSMNESSISDTFLKAIAKHESGLNPTISSPTGAKGLFQFTSGTARAYNVDDPNDPEQATRGASKLVEDLANQFEDDPEKILAAYNAGPAVVKQAEELAQANGTDWKDEVGNTDAINSVARNIARVKKISPVQAKEQKIKEITQHRDAIMGYYNELNASQKKELSLDDLANFDFGAEEQEPEQEGTFGGAFGASTVAGSEGVAKSVLQMPRSVLSTYIGLQNAFNSAIMLHPSAPNLKVYDEDEVKAILDKYTPNSPEVIALKKDIEKNQEKVQKFTGPDSVLDKLKKGDVTGARDKVIINAGGQIAQLAGVIGGSLLGVPSPAIVGGLSSMALAEGTDKYWDDFEKGLTSQGVELASVNNLVNSIIEGYTESIGTVSLTAPLRKVFKKLSKDLGEETAKRVIGNASGRIAGKIGQIGKGAIQGAKQEAIEEFTAGFSQKVSDKVFGSDPDATFSDAFDEGFEGATTAIVSGGGLGTFTSTLTAQPRQLDTGELQIVDEKAQDAEFLARDDSEPIRALFSYNKDTDSFELGGKEISQEEIANLDLTKLAEEAKRTGDSFEIDVPKTVGEEVTRIDQKVTQEDEVTDQEDDQVDTEEDPDVLSAEEEAELATLRADPEADVQDATQAPLEGQGATIAPETTPTTPETTKSRDEAPTASTEDVAPIDVKGTEEDTKHGKDLAKKVEGVKFDGVQDGVIDPKRNKPVMLSFSTKTKDKVANFSVPVDATVEDVQKALEAKLAEIKDSDPVIIPKVTRKTTVEASTSDVVNDPRMFEGMKYKKVVEFYTRVMGEAPAPRTQATTLVAKIVEKVGTDRAKERLGRMKETKAAANKAAQEGKKRGAIASNSVRGFIGALSETGSLPYDPTAKLTRTDGNKKTELTVEQAVNEYNNEQTTRVVSKKGEPDRVETVDKHKNKITIVEGEDGKKNLILKVSKKRVVKETGIEEVIVDNIDNSVAGGATDVNVGTVDFNKVDLKPSEQIEVTKIADEGGAEYNSKTHDSLIARGILEKIVDPSGETFVDIAVDEKEVVKYTKEQIKNDSPIRFRRKGDIGKGLTGKKSIKAMMDVVKSMFSLDQIDIRFGSQQNPVLDDNGKVLDDFSDGSYGGYSSYKGKPLITINTGTQNTNTFGSFIHEAIGHFGTEKVFDAFPEFQKYAESLFKRDKNSENLKRIQENYDEADWFKEWVALHVEQASTEFFNEDGSINEARFDKADNVAKQLFKKIRDILSKLFKMAPTSEEITAMTETIFSKVRELSDTAAVIEDDASGRQKILDAKPKKFNSEKEKLKTKLHDKLALGSAKTVKTTVTRLQRYLTNHIGNTNEKIAILKNIDKIESIEKDKKGKYIDANLRKVLKQFDENSERGDVTRELRGFMKTASDVGKKAPKELIEIATKAKEFRDRITEWKSLAMMAKFGDIRVKKLDGEQKIGPTFAKHLANGYIYDPVTVLSPRKKYMLYRLTPKGRARYNELTHEFNNLTEDTFTEKGARVKGEKTTLVRYIETERVALAEALFNFKQEEAQRKRGKRSKASEEGTQMATQIELEKQDMSGFGKFKRKMRSLTQAPIIKQLYTATKAVDMFTSQTLGAITYGLDSFTKDGFFTKNITNRVRDAESATIEYKREAKNRLAADLEGKVDLTKFSRMFHNGMLNSVLRLSPKIRDKQVEMHEYVDASGQKYSLTADQRVAMFLHAKRNESVIHLLNGGFTLSDKERNVYKLTPELLTEIISDVKNSKDELILAKALEKHFKFSGKKINETSLKDIGYELATGEFYFPIKTKRYSQKSGEIEAELGGARRFVGYMNFNNLKKTTNASNPIVLEGAMEAAARTENMVADYVGKAVPMAELTRLFGAEIEINGMKTNLKEYMHDNGFGAEETIIQWIISNINKTASKHMPLRAVEGTFRFFRNLKTIGVLGHKIGVAAIQPASYFSSNVEHGYPLRFWFKPPVKFDKLLTDFYEKSSLLFDRFNNHLDRDAGEALSSADGRGLFTWDNKLQTFVSYAKQGKAFTAEAAMSFITRTDAKAIMGILNDVSHGVMKEHNVEYGSAEFFKIAVPIVEATIEDTQPTWSTHTRPIGLSIELLKPFTMFMSQPIKNLQMTRRAVINVTRGFANKDGKMLKKGASQLAAVAIVQPLVVTLIREMWRGARGKWEDDEEEFFEKMWKGYAMSMVGMYPLIGSVLVELIRTKGKELGVDRSAPLFDFFVDTYNFTKSMSKHLSGDKISHKRGVSNEEVLLEKGLKILADGGISAQGIKDDIDVLLNFKKQLEEAGQ